MRRSLLTALALCGFMAAPLPTLADGVDATALTRELMQMDERELEAAALVLRAFRQIEDRYYEPVDPEELARKAVQAMVGDLDPYSSLMSPEDLAKSRERSSGRFAGIGVRFQPQTDGVLVGEVMAQSPAKAAGLRVGDVILAVDGRSVVGLSQNEVRDLLAGEPDQPVDLTIARSGTAAPFDVRIVRGMVAVSSVTAHAVGTVGYVRIDSFNQSTYPGVVEALQRLQAQVGPGLRGYVLDLRQNPGGLVRAAVQTADAFLDDGTIITAEGRTSDSFTVHKAKPGDLALGLPVILLVDGKSASAAEILTGALQDHGRAIVVGTKTYGKGVIQSIIPMPHGGALKLTTARYLTPTGTAIHEIGIEPDVRVEVPEGTVLNLGAAPNPAGDPQFARALAILHGMPQGPGSI